MQSILVIEDEADLCNVILDTLQAAGFSPIGVTNAREATFKLRNQNFACVVLDMHLGEETGEGVVGFMRKNNALPNFQTPIIVVSGFIDRELLQRVGPHIQGALVKPFKMEMLVELVKKICHRNDPVDELDEDPLAGLPE